MSGCFTALSPDIVRLSMGKHLPTWATGTFSHRTATVDGTSIPYLLGGDGMPLLLIHGLGASFDWWQFNAPQLADNFSVYLVDLPGFGRLRNLGSASTMDEYADWVDRFLEAAELERVHVGGISMGAEIALRLAARYPERVDRLVLVTPAAILRGDLPLRHSLTTLRVLTELPASLLPLAAWNGLRTSISTFWKASSSMVSQDVQDMLPEIQAQTLVIASNNDPVLSLSRASTYFQLIPRSQLVVFPGTRHLIMLADPERFNRVTRTFLLTGQI
jgi:pimeloyl-ACP methyl ester carboxylesterase